MSVITGGTRQEVMVKAILAACKPCCGSGSGSGSGVPFPNGCAACDCCPCVCWWYTTWHKSITVASLLYTPGFASDWTLTANTLVKVGGDPDYMYFANSGVGDCTLTGLFALDENGDITDDLPYVPQWTGDLTYTSIYGTVTFNVTVSLLFTLAFGCDNPYEAGDAIVWFGTAINSSDPVGYGFNGQSITPPLPDPPGFVDVGLPPNDFIGGSGTITDCGGTLAIDGPGINLPSLTFVPMLDPNCVV